MRVPLIQRLLRHDAVSDGAVAAAPPRRRRPAPPPTELRRERKALLRLREQKLRDLGGLSLEMYRRDSFREDLLLERCAELIGLEARIHELDVMLGTVRPSAGVPRTARCDCGAPLLWGSRFCASCGRPVATGGSSGGNRGQTKMSEPGSLRCPRCNAAVLPGQEYCLECGGRLEQARPGAVERASVGVSDRHRWAGAWLLPALLGLVIAVLGTGAAIAISDESREPSAPSTATGGNISVTDSVSTLTAPEPTETTPTTTAPATTAPTTTAPPPPPANPAAVSWPRNQRGWTIVLLSLPQANGRSAAAAQATEARSGGLRRVGVLDSSRYASLHPGYYVVFTGVFETEAEAASALQRARAVFPAAYQREIVP